LPVVLVFFFQAEDGIRDRTVTGVQTCALPIYTDLDLQLKKHGIHKLVVIGLRAHTCVEATVRFAAELGYEVTMVKDAPRITRMRSEERRVGKECRSRWTAEH